MKSLMKSLYRTDGKKSTADTEYVILHAVKLSAAAARLIDEKKLLKYNEDTGRNARDQRKYAHAADADTA